jgi:vancomycin permeability regulator SanA
MKRINLEGIKNRIYHLGKRMGLLLILLINLAIFSSLFLMRYKNQGYAISISSLNNFSNILNLIHFSIITILIIICIIRANHIDKKHIIFLFLLMLSIFSLVITRIIFPDFYRDRISITTVCLLLLTISYIIFILSDKKKKFIMSILVTFINILFIILVVVIYVFSYYPNNYDVMNGDVTYDAAVIFGAAVWSDNKPSPVLRERILKALSLYRNNKIKYFIVTGSNTPGRLSEAEVEKAFLINKEVDDSLIIAENNTRSTSEQVIFVRDSIYNKRNYKNLIIVSDNFHLRRISEMFKFSGITPIGVSSDSPLKNESLIFYSLRESVGLILFWYFGV